MSTVHHVPHGYHADLTSAEINRPLGELDAAIETVITTGSGVSTTLTAQAGAGQASLTVASSAGFAPGDPIYLGTGAMFESRIIATVPGGGVTITVTVNLTNTYAIGKPVSKSPVEIVAARGWATTLGGRIGLIEGQTHDPMRYGAAGNGVTDDTAAVAAAITGAGVGGHVTLSRVHAVTAPLSLLDGQTVSGMGMRSGIIRQGALGTPVFDGGADLSDVTLEGFYVNDERAATWGNDCRIVAALRPTRWRIRGVQMAGQGTGYSQGVSFDGGADNVVSTCHFAHLGYGVVIGTAPDAAYACDRNIVTGCTFESIDGNGIFFTGSLPSTASTSHPKGNIAIGNALTGCGDTAIESGIGCIGTVIEGNTISGGAGSYLGLSGILIRDNADALVQGNTIANIAGASSCGIGVRNQFGINQNITIGPNDIQACYRGLDIDHCVSINVTGGAYHDNSDSGINVLSTYDYSFTGVHSFQNGQSGFSFATDAVRGNLSGCLARDNAITGFVTQSASVQELSFDGCVGYDSRVGGARTQVVGLNAWAGTSIWQHGGRFYNNTSTNVNNNIGAEFHSA